MAALQPQTINAIQQAYNAYAEGRFEVARTQIDAVIAQAPDQPESRYLQALLALALQEVDEAVELAQSMLRESIVDEPHPVYKKTLKLLGAASQSRNELTDAFDYFTQALALPPQTLDDSIDLAQCQIAQKDPEAARKTLASVPDTLADPKHARWLAAQAEIAWQLWEVPDATNYLLQAVKASPTNLDLVSQYLYSLNYLDLEDETEAARQHLALGQALASRLSNAPSHQPNSMPGNLRLGFISPDLKRHSVAFFLIPLLRQLASQKNVEVFCYATSAIKDATTAQIQSLCTTFKSVSLRNAAQVIKEDSLDVLIDLAGHTSGNAMPLCLMQRGELPSRLITWLGYPNTTGFEQFDYRIVDELTDPIVGNREPAAEKRLYLPEGFLCYEPPEQAPEVGELPWVSNGFRTFGCFNNLNKVHIGQIKLWAELLRKHPQDRLILKDRALHHASVRDKILRVFESQGVPSERITLRDRTESLWEHLNLYNRVDIALDTHPYNGTTTTFEALFMGCPVLTINGQSHRSRVSASILNRMHLDDWIQPDTTALIAFVSSCKYDELAKLRACLRERLLASALCNAERFALAFIEALRGLSVKDS
jgi:protein O-GlcNAc transferase